MRLCVVQVLSGILHQVEQCSPPHVAGGMLKGIVRWMVEGNQVDRLACLQQARTSPFWVGDLANVKSALLDWIDDGSHESCQVVKSAWRAHVRREQASLLLLAVTKTSICSVGGSLDSAREQGVLLGDSRAWDRLLLETAGSGNLVLSLVMPFVPHRRLRGFDDRPSDPCGTSGTQ